MIYNLDGYISFLSAIKHGEFDQLVPIWVVQTHGQNESTQRLRQTERGEPKGGGGPGVTTGRQGQVLAPR